MSAQKFNPQKLQQLINLSTSPRERKMYRSLLEKALIEEQKAEAKRRIQDQALAEAEALKAKLASPTYSLQSETIDEETDNSNATMNQPEKIIGAKKTKHYREYTVKEHQRKLYERVYKFVCSGCDKTVERTSYALCCPSYGLECDGKKSKCRRYKK